MRTRTLQPDRAGRKPAAPRRPGVILLVVLAVVALLAVLGATFAYRMRAELHSVSSVSYDLQARLAAEAGIQRALLILRTERNDIDKWYDNEEAFRRIIVWTPGQIGGKTDLAQEAEEGQPAWRFSLIAPVEGTLNDMATKWRYGVTDEASKLNLNMATRDALIALFRQRQLENVTPQELADCLLDWIDADDTPREFGAETSYYQTLNPPYKAKNSALESVEELLLVKHFNGRILYGEDSNRNGHLDKNEDDGEDGQFPLDNGDGQLDRGIYPFVTVYSRDMNRANDNSVRINVNGSLECEKCPDEVKAEIEQYLRPEVREFILNAQKRGYKFKSIAEMYRLRIGGEEDEEGGGDETENEGENPGDGSGENENAGPDGNADGSGRMDDNGRRNDDGGGDVENGGGASDGTPDDDRLSPEEKEDVKRQQARRSPGRRVPPPTMEDLERLRNERGAGRGPRDNADVPPPPGGDDSSGSGETGSDRGRRDDRDRRDGGRDSRRGDSNRVGGDRASDGSREEAGGERAGGGRRGDREADGRGGRGGREGPGGANNQPPLDSPVEGDDLMFLMDRFTADPSPVQYGLINVNTAPREVLMTLPGITAQDADAIVSARQGLDAATRRTPAWLAVQEVIPPAKFRRIGPYITARSLQYTIESFGFADHVGTYKRLQAVVEMRGQVEQVLYWRDISGLGVGYPLHEDEWKYEVSVGSR